MAAAEPIWRTFDETNLEVSDDGRVRRSGIEFTPWIDGAGYYTVDIGRRKVLLHRMIAIAFIENPLGKPCVDHINGNPLDNRVSNLQWATRGENARNCKPHTKASGLPRGVSLTMSGRYVAKISYNNIKTHLGTFDTAAEASAIYEATAQELFGSFYRPLTQQSDELHQEA